MFNENGTNSPSSLTGSNLGLNIGDTLQLQIVNDVSVRVYCKLIGYLPGKSLVVTSPRVEGKLCKLNEGRVITVRMLSGNTVLGFDSKVIYSARTPYPHIHLACPFSTGKILVRKAQRIKSEIIVSVLGESTEICAVKPISAVTYDISTSGAMLEAKDELGQVGDLLTLKTRINLGGNSEYLTIPATLKNIRFDKNPVSGRSLYYHGVEFQILEQQDNIVLHGFIFEKMVSIK